MSETGRGSGGGWNVDPSGLMVSPTASGSISRSEELRSDHREGSADHWRGDPGQRDEQRTHRHQHVPTPPFDNRARQSDRLQNIDGGPGSKNRCADQQEHEYCRGSGECCRGLRGADRETLGRQTGEERTCSAEACEKVAKPVHEVATWDRPGWRRIEA